MINLIVILMLATGSQGGRTLAEGDGAVSRVFVQSPASTEALEKLVADHALEVRSNLVVRLAIYESQADLARAESGKPTDVSMQSWNERFDEDRRLARPAAEFVKIGPRACFRLFARKSVTLQKVAGYREIDHDLCMGCDVQFLYLGARVVRTLQTGVPPYRDLTADFLYKGDFSEDSARAAMKELGLDSARHASVVFMPDPSNLLDTVYPYFNRFIDPKLYSSLSGSAGKYMSCWTGAQPVVECATF